MKKLIWSVLITLVIVCSQSSVNAQAFEGKITMKIEYEEVPEEYEPYIGMFPKEAITYVKEKKTRSEQNSAMGTNIEIMDSETKKGYIITNGMAGKAAYEMNMPAEEKKDTSNIPVVTYTNETKTIAGYTCKKAELKYKDSEEPMVVWYTEEITDVYNAEYAGLGIKGSILEFTTSRMGMVLTMTVSEIKKEKISDDMFKVPEGYEVKPYSEFLKLGQQGDK